MTITYSQIVTVPFLGGLKNAHAFITKAYEHAKTNNIDPEEYLSARLYPDMLTFTEQVYRFTDNAKFVPFRVNPEIEALTLPDVEKTFPELLERIEKTIKYFETMDTSKLDGQEDSEVVLQVGSRGVQIDFVGLNYLLNYAQPNFWFHISTAYDILRHKGVPLGKLDFLNGAGLIKFSTLPPKPE